MFPPFPQGIHPEPLAAKSPEEIKEEKAALKAASEATKQAALAVDLGSKKRKAEPKTSAVPAGKKMSKKIPSSPA